jgi:hypothetical protein
LPSVGHWLELRLLLLSVFLSKPPELPLEATTNPARLVCLLLVVSHRFSELLIVCSDEVDIALVLDTRRWRLQRGIGSDEIQAETALLMPK